MPDNVRTILYGPGVVLSYTATVGTVPGYGEHLADGRQLLNENSPEGDRVRHEARRRAADAWHAAAADIYQASGIYVPGVIADGRAIYPAAAGCPVAGEPVHVIVGTLNPQYLPAVNLDRQRDTVGQVLDLVRLVLGQTTAQVAFSDGSFIYLRPDDGPSDGADDYDFDAPDDHEAAAAAMPHDMWGGES